MLERFRGLSHTVLGPVARLLVKLGVSPDLVTIIGTLGVVLGALICFPQGWLWQGVVVVIIFVISDMIDGLMAKITGKSSNWGAFLDSTSDRPSICCLGLSAHLGDALHYGDHARHRQRRHRNIQHVWHTEASEQCTGKDDHQPVRPRGQPASTGESETLCSGLHIGGPLPKDQASQRDACPEG